MLSRMTKQTRERWEARIREWRESGKSAEDFAADKDYEASSLRWAVSRLGSEEKAREATATEVQSRPRGTSIATPRFAPVHVRRTAATSAEMVVEVGGAQIRVARGMDMALLGDVVHALRGGNR